MLAPLAPGPRPGVCIDHTYDYVNLNTPVKSWVTTCTVHDTVTGYIDHDDIAINYSHVHSLLFLKYVRYIDIVMDINIVSIR